jgi:transcriptional regulator with XRE-family HTH domain
MKVSEALREALRRADQSRFAIAKETGISESVLSRFLSGKTAIGSENLDTLAAYFQMELVKKPGKTRKEA